MKFTFYKTPITSDKTEFTSTMKYSKIQLRGINTIQLKTAGDNKN